MGFFKAGKDEKSRAAFEELLGGEWSQGLDFVEVRLNNKPFIYLGMAVIAVAAVFLFRIFYLNVYRGEFYGARAEGNVTKNEMTAAPRGLIYGRNGEILAENLAVFTATLDIKKFLESEDIEELASSIESALRIPGEKIWELVKESSENNFISPVVLEENLTQDQVVFLKSLDLPAVSVKKDFRRKYGGGKPFSSVLGYVGWASIKDMQGNQNIGSGDFVGRAGVEMFYDNDIRGEPGIVSLRRDAKGGVLSEEKMSDPRIGKPLRLTIDEEFQKYFYSRLASGLNFLGRNVGVGLAYDPRNGEILALTNLPGFDSNLLSSTGGSSEKLSILNSRFKPLFNRATSGLYNPGSTIKPLVALAALAEGVINPDRKLFSPGFIDIPNPYDPESFSRYRDWRYQGYVDLSSAIAQSSNVYFYAVGGGLPRGVSVEVLAGGGYIEGLGISRLYDWWEKFKLGGALGVDLPGEAKGILPTPEWKKENIGGEWFLGDTYNVSIGQGDLLITPLQLLSYISAIANKGMIWQPHINKELSPRLLADLSSLEPQMREVRIGMKEAVTSELGTAYLLHDLGFSLGAKTGTVQVRSGAQENAIFVGFAPFDDPKIAILILVENSVEGSLNTVPIAKDVLSWYYWNRVRNSL